MEIIPFDKRIGFIWYNGEIVEWQDATTHVLNHGLHYGSCVFEGLRVYSSNIYKLEQHTDRLFHSANRMGIEVPYTKNELNDANKLNQFIRIYLYSFLNVKEYNFNRNLILIYSLPYIIS